MKKRSSSPLISAKTNSARYVNLILIILTIFIALIRRRHDELVAENVAPKSIASYTFSDVAHQSAEWSALAMLLKSHDLAAEVLVSSRSPNGNDVAVITKYLEQIGIPFEAYRVLGKVGNREEINVKVYKIARAKA